jgi:hypothetical protein
MIWEKLTLMSQYPISQNQAQEESVESGPRNFRTNHLNRSSRYGSRPGERGQVVVEYVLLLVASVTLALLVTRLMVGRDPGNPGFVMSAWDAMVKEIGSDNADDIRR